MNKSVYPVIGTLHPGHGSVLARAGQHLGPVEGHGDPAHLEHAAARAHLDDLGKAAREQFAVDAAEGADRVVIGMRVRAEQPHRHAVMGRPLDLPAGEDARGVAVNEQTQQQARRIIYVSFLSFNKRDQRWSRFLFPATSRALHARRGCRWPRSLG